MKCLLLTDGIYPYVVGGMQKHSFYLAKYLAIRGVEVHLAHCLYDHNQALPNSQEVNEQLFSKQEASIQSQAFHFPKFLIPFPGHYVLSSYLYSKRVYEYFKPNLASYDLIYIKGFSGWYLLRHEHTVKSKTWINFHGYEMFQYLPSWRMKLEGLLLRWAVQKTVKPADAVVSYGGKITSLCQQIFKGKQVIEIPAGIEDHHIASHISRAMAPKDSPRRLMFVGRYEKRKGVEILHQCLQNLLDRKFSLECHFVGPIPMHLRIKSNQIVYHDLVKNPQELRMLYQSADVVLVPSFSEGMPNVIMEAMLNGCAVLSTDVGACSILVGSDNGWLIEEKKPGILLRYLEEILRCSDMDLEQKKWKSIEKIQQFTWSRVIELTLNAFHSPKP